MRLLLVLMVLAASTASRAQEAEDSREDDERIELDLSFDYDPEELRETWRDRVRFKRIYKSFGLAGYHVPPAAESGPHPGPPLRFWSNGFGTSLWRDPVTGWPLQ